MMTPEDLQRQQEIDQQLTLPGTADSLPGFSLTTPDQKIQTMQTIEKQWDLPPLPDAVKLDLAMKNDQDHQGLTDFLWGIASDLNKAINPFAADPAGASQTHLDPSVVSDGITNVPQASPLVQLPTFDPNDPSNKLRSIVRGIAGDPPPQSLDVNAIDAFKQKAIQQGLLSPADAQKSMWDPVMETMWHQMAEQDFQKRLSGDRPGGFSVNDVMKWVGEWAQPSQLGKAAVALGFVPDIKRMQQTGEEHHNAIADWLSHPTSPSRFLKMLAGVAGEAVPGGGVGFQAAASLIGGGHDLSGVRQEAGNEANLVLPVINDLLLLSGVSEVVAAGRVAVAAPEAIDAARAAVYGGEGSWWAQKTVQAADAAGRAAEPSLLSKVSGRAGTYLTTKGPMLEKAGEGLQGASLTMEKWRALKGVQLAKATTGMLAQRGIVGTAESKLFPDLNIYSGNPVSALGGPKLENGRDLQQWKQAKLPWPIETTWDLALAPPTFFKPGTFTRVGQATKGLIQAVTDVPKDTRLVDSVFNAVADTVQDPAARQRLQDLNKSVGPWHALVQEVGGGDELAAANFVNWATAITAVDKDPMARALQVYGSATENPGGFERAFHAGRNGVVGQISKIHEGDAQTFLNRINDITGDNTAARRWASLLGESDGQIPGQGVLFPEAASAQSNARDLMNMVIRDHNDKADGVLRAITSRVSPEDVQQFVSTYFKNHLDWSKFVEASDHLDEVFQPGGIGDTLNLAYKPTVSQAGRQLGGSTEINPAGYITKDLLRIAKEDPELLQKANAMPLARQIGTGQVGLMRLDTPTKQEADAFLHLLQSQKGDLETLTTLGQRTDMQANLAKVMTDLQDAEGKPWYEVSRAKFEEAIHQAYRDMQTEAGAVATSGATPDTVKSAMLLRKLARTNPDQYDFTNTMLMSGGRTIIPDVGKARNDLESTLVGLSNHSLWEDLGISPLTGDLDAKIKALKSKRAWIAAEVDGLPEDTVRFLADRGYKAVYGGPWVTPRDVWNNVHPFAEVSDLQRAQMRLGSFLSPVKDTYIGAAQGARLRANLTSKLIELGELPKSAAGEAVNGKAGLTDDIVGRLWDAVSANKEAVDQAMKASENQGIFSKLLTNLASSKAAIGLRDLTAKQIAAALPEYAGNQRVLNAVQWAVKDAYDVGFRLQGLQAIEDHLRAENVLTRGLTLLGKTDTGERLAREGEGVLPRLGEALKGAGRRAAVGSVLGAGAGLAEGLYTGQDIGTVAQRTAQGAAIGAGVGAAAPVLGRAGVGALPGAAVGAGAAALAGQNPAQGAALGAVAGAGVTLPFGPAIADKLSPALEASKWYRYGFLPDELARLRNYARFTISPFFDLRRYVKGNFIAQTAELPDGVTLPLNNSLKALEREMGTDAANKAKAMWDSASHGSFDAVDDTVRFYRNKGLLGFSPQEHMASTMYRLVDQGVDPEKAYDLTRKIWAYGTGRSPLEKSVNFIFFPFSFEKKVIANTGRLLGQDMTRLMFVHDALATYNLLNQHYDLSKELEQHMPVLKDLEKLNVFDHGISPGELGGVNRPILNLFLPQLASIEGQQDAHSWQQLASRLVPAYSDVNHLVEDLASQGHVIFGKNHLTQQAEADEGYAHFNKLKLEVDQAAKDLGFNGLSDVYRKNRLKPLHDLLTAQKSDLYAKYPAFEQSQLDAMRKREELDANVKVMAAHPTSTAQKQFIDFYLKEQDLREALKKQTGIDIASAPAEAPPDVVQAIQAEALRYAMTGDGFEKLWDRYYRRQYGPITTVGA